MRTVKVPVVASIFFVCISCLAVSARVHRQRTESSDPSRFAAVAAGIESSPSDRRNRWSRSRNTGHAACRAMGRAGIYHGGRGFRAYRGIHDSQLVGRRRYGNDRDHRVSSESHKRWWWNRAFAVPCARCFGSVGAGAGCSQACSDRGRRRGYGTRVQESGGCRGKGPVSAQCRS